MADMVPAMLTGLHTSHKEDLRHVISVKFTVLFDFRDFEPSRSAATREIFSLAHEKATIKMELRLFRACLYRLARAKNPLRLERRHPFLLKSQKNGSLTPGNHDYAMRL